MSNFSDFPNGITNRIQQASLDYNPLIIKSSVLLDDSRTITEIDKQTYFMEKKKKLYNKHSYTDHTQDLINLLSNNEFRDKINNLLKEKSNGNNDEIHKKIEDMFKVQTKIEQEENCDETNSDNKKSECPEDIENKPTHLINQQQYLILDILYTINTDKHELYTNKQKDGIFSCKFNNLDNADPGLYVTALNVSNSI